MNTLEQLIGQLSSSDGVVRERARKQIVALAEPETVNSLMGQLTDSRRRVRWEAVKALSAIGKPESAAALVRAMDDDDRDIAWIAADGVSGMGERGLEAVLSGLTRDSRSGEYPKAAHHALKGFRNRGIRREIVERVMKSLEGLEPRLTAPVVAYAALEEMHGAVLLVNA